MNKKIIASLAVLVIVATISGINMVNAEEVTIPPWVKGVFAYYVQGDMKDSELIDALEFLIDKGIINIDEKTYEKFSLEKFPNTGGFNPEWLKNEREDIIKNCNEARAVGYENSYCEYVQ